VNPVQVTVDVDLQEQRGVVSRSSRRSSNRTVKPQFDQIKFINKQINDAHRIISIDIVVQTCRHQCDLVPTLAFNESLHREPPRLCLMHRPQKTIRVHPFSHDLDPQRPVNFLQTGRSAKPDSHAMDCSEAVAGDLSLISSNASHQHSIQPGESCDLERSEIDTRPMREYLAALACETLAVAPRKISLSDPHSRWTAATGGIAFFA
jgi:hypothetical protein